MGIFIRERPRRNILRFPPPAVLIIIYASLILIGTVLLKLPVASTAATTWMTALFTAASAVTVTGLVLVDTGSHFTVFGQFVIVSLIQLGGLGLMTFAAFVLSVLGMRIPLRQRLVLSEDLNHTDLGGLLDLVSLILRVVIACEVAGAILLSFTFVPELGWWDGMWNSVFHSISAFNNAGFALYPDSLSRWVADPIVNLTIPSLFIVGGLGYAVLSDLWQTRNWSGLSLHSKLMLAGTIALIVFSVVTVALLEWRNPATLGGMAIDAKFWGAWFQGVTTRTAGFNTLDIGALHDSTALMMIALMMIGGGSTSTAGGIKVTTFMVLCLATIAFLKRRETISVFGRSLGTEEILKALALAMISVAVLIVALFTLSITSDVVFLDLLFEVASALGTVGLSRGATGEFDTFGQLVLIAVMFIGRVGPLSLGFFLGARAVARIRYPSSRVYLG